MGDTGPTDSKGWVNFFYNTAVFAAGPGPAVGDRAAHRAEPKDTSGDACKYHCQQAWG